jgi:branched-chain amino acid transport system permease protein
MIQIIVDGIISGAAISLLASAFMMTYLPTRIFHVPLGGIYTIAPCIVWTVIKSGIGMTWGILFACLMGGVLSLGCEVLNHNRLRHKSSSEGAHLISSLGLYLVFGQFAILIWGNDPKVLRLGLSQTMHWGQVAVTEAQAVTVVVSGVVLVCCYGWLRASRLGLQLRALADNPNELGLQGVNCSWLYRLAFGLSGVVASICALLAAYDVGFDPNAGLSSALLAIAAMLIGGQQSFFGVVLGGMILGLVRSGVVWTMSSSWQDTVTFLLLAAFLLLRPQGILGQRLRLEADS